MYVAGWVHASGARSSPFSGAHRRRTGRFRIHAVYETSEALSARVLPRITRAGTTPRRELETARRVLQRIRTVLDWAIAAGHRETASPVEGVVEGFPRQRDRVEHHDALPWGDVPALMQALATDKGMGSLALRFAILTAARSGEVRGAMWQEIDLEAATWTIPGNRILSVRALSPTLVFPSPKSSMAESKPLSEMALVAALRRLKIKAAPHGFRSTFRDWAEEATHYPHEVKEAALAHTVKNKTEAAYRRSDLFEKRREMMEAWGAYTTRIGGKVVSIRA